MKELVFTLLMVTSLTIANAQEVVSSAGETQTVSGYEVSWTLGEAVIETHTAGSNILTQGFHQTKLTITALEELSVSELEVKVYPNPTSEFVIVHFKGNDITSQYLLYDLSGKLLQQNLIAKNDTRIDMINYSNGAYILKLIDDNNHPIQHFKIVKR